jgi:hypothetical protein
MTPLYWTKWFNKFYDKVKNDTKFNSIPITSNKAAVIIEPRKHPLLKQVIYNFMYLLPSDWSLHIFCGSDNYDFVKESILFNCNIHTLPQSNLTEQDYNNLLTSSSFYTEYFNSEHILIFQTDTILLKDNINDFLHFDIIGAPWSFSRDKGCNGGLSLRKRSKMLEIIQTSSKCVENEDGFFSFTNAHKLNINPSFENKNKFSVETVIHEDPLGMHKPYCFQSHNYLQNILQNAWKRIFNTSETIFTEDDIIMTTDQILNTIHELGHFKFDSMTGKIDVKFPIYTVHTGRLDALFKYIISYLRIHGKYGMECYYTVYDAWREHSEPSNNAIFVNATPAILEPYKGYGSAGEPGRFIHPIKMKNIFPIFNQKVLAFGRHKNDPYTMLIPDFDFIRTNGYTQLLQEINEKDTLKWFQKINKIFWRGGLHGVGYEAYDNVTRPRCQRKMLCDLNESYLDASLSYITSKETFLQYKYLIDVDGEVNSWSALWWKLYSNTVLFKVDSHYEQWYYKNLKEWIHYIPVKADLSDLSEKYQWALEHEEECKKINEESTKFIKQHTFEYVLHNYKIE